jgi:hypothetical protein
MAAVFLSYRRDDAAGYAVGINKALRDAGFEVFMDVDSIAPGDRFPAAIQEALDASEALVVLIGKRWLTVEDSRGRRRLDDRRDYVRREVVAALDRGIDVIPTLVDGAGVPSEADLPGRLSKLAEFQCLELDNDRWDYDLGRLVKRLRRRSGQPNIARRFWNGLSAHGRPGRRWVVATVAVLAAVAVAVVVTSLVGGGSSTSSKPPPPPAEVATATRVGARSLLSAGSQLISAAIAGPGSTLVAVGRDGNDQQSYVARAWRSTDAGRHWSPAAIAPGATAVNEQMRAIVRLAGGQFAAVGHRSGDLTTWLSSNGSSWSSPSVYSLDGGQVVKAAVATPHALIAVGGQSTATGQGRDAAVWRSTDNGRSWENVSDFGGTDTQVIQGIVTLGSRLVAVGYDNAAGAVAWTSGNDGTSWERLPIPALGTHEQMNAVTADGSVLVAVGNEGSGQATDAAVWTSSDGQTWKRQDRRDFAVQGAQKLGAVVASPIGLFAVGSDKSGGAQRAAAWRSTDDAKTWKPVGGFSGPGPDAYGSMNAAVALDQVVLGLGQGILAGDADAAAWRIRLHK